MSTRQRDYDFATKVAQVISGRAGYRCSYPGCGRLLVGPGDGKGRVANLGEIGHIHSGSPDGPRYDKSLDSGQLKSEQNGIFLCRHHHKLVDSLQSEFSVPDLLRMKHHHEYSVSVELGVLAYPPVWIDKIIFNKFELFRNRTIIQLGRVNHVFGEAGLGKTAILEVLNSVLTGVLDRRWSDTEIEMHLHVSTKDRPELATRVRICQGSIRYALGHREIPLFPEGYFVVFLKKELKDHQDDLEAIRRCYAFPPGFLERLLCNGRFKGLTTSNHSLKTLRTKPYLTRELHVNVGNRFNQSFGTCSASEQGRVLLDIGIASATMMSQFRPVILLIDWVNIGMFDVERFIPYIEFLFSSKALFQTIFVSPGPINKLRWTGWQKIELYGGRRSAAIRQ